MYRIRETNVLEILCLQREVNKIYVDSRPGRDFKVKKLYSIIFIQSNFTDTILQYHFLASSHIFVTKIKTTLRFDITKVSLFVIFVMLHQQNQPFTKYDIDYELIYSLSLLILKKVLSCIDN